ncbi:MAG: hypothetical protein WCA89_01555 [Terracidiphilus sp.]|jgi:hypothetical protein
MKYYIPLIATSAALLLPLSAHSYCFQPQPRLVCGEYFDSKLIIEATLVQIDSVGDPDSPDAYNYTLQVDRILVGKSDTTIHVYEGNDSGRASFYWVKGRKYLLFLRYHDDFKAWVLDGCGNSGPLRKAGKALAQIAAIQTAHDGGWIRGEFSDRSEGVRIVAEGSAGVFSTESGKQGIFKIKVPAGQYNLRAADPDGVFKYIKADFSYEDPENIHIVPGSCAQVEFTQVDAKSPQKK